jgi:hypothetical protein
MIGPLKMSMSTKASTETSPRRCYGQRRTALSISIMTHIAPLSKQNDSLNPVLDHAALVECHPTCRRYCRRILRGYVRCGHFDKTLTIRACDAELRNAKSCFKDVLAVAISNNDLYEVEVTIARVERRHPHLTEENFAQAQESEDLIDKEVKQRETQYSTHYLFLKLGYQIRGHVKPNSTKKSCLNRLDVQLEDGLWHQVSGIG